MKNLGSFIHFNERLQIVAIGLYNDLTPVLDLIDEDGDPYARLTVCLERRPELQVNEFCVKTWSENAPVAETLLKSGLFVDTGKRYTTGFVEAQIWRYVISPPIEKGQLEKLKTIAEKL